MRTDGLMYGRLRNEGRTEESIWKNFNGGWKGRKQCFARIVLTFNTTLSKTILNFEPFLEFFEPLTSGTLKKLFLEGRFLSLSVDST